jgi:hypothetical protein
VYSPGRTTHGLITHLVGARLASPHRGVYLIYIYLTLWACIPSHTGAPYRPYTSGFVIFEFEKIVFGKGSQYDTPPYGSQFCRPNGRYILLVPPCSISRERKHEPLRQASRSSHLTALSQLYVVQFAKFSQTGGKSDTSHCATY